MEKIREVLIKENLVNTGETIGIACSGGIDSMCLLVSMSQLAIDMHFKVVAINIDHCIRGEASTRDSEFVEAFCKAIIFL
jgi:tRNA(Ile)-lysidine synthase TilS/MesJ